MKTVWLVIIGALTIGTSGAAQSGRPIRPCGIPDFPAPELCARAGLDTVPASYLLVVDESGSMQPMWDGVRSALADFARAVPDRSELDVRLFADRVRDRIPATTASEAVRQNWARELAGLSAPRGPRTDLGRAAEAAVDRLSSAPPDRLQFVFFLTDGEQDPAPGSPFTPTWNDAWQALAAKAQKVVGSRPVRVGLIRLSPAANVSLLQRVFPDAVVTDAMSAAALRAWFANQAREGAVSKLRLLVAEDLDRPAVVLDAREPVRTYQGRPVHRQLFIHTGRKLVSSRLENGKIPLPGGGEIELPDDVVLEPGSPPRSVEASIRDREYPPFLPPGIRRRSIQDNLPIAVTIGPTVELARIGIDASDDATHLRAAIILVGGGSLAWPLYIAVTGLVLATLVAAGISLKWKMHRPYLPGRLVVRRSNDSNRGELSEETIILSGRKLKVYSVMQPDGRHFITYEARSERGRTVVYAMPGDREVLVGGKRLLAPMVVKKVSRFESNDGEITYFPR